MDLSGLDLTGATFQHCNLSGTLFAGATLANVTWSYGLCPDGITAVPPSCCAAHSCCDQLIDVPATCTPP